MKISSRESGTLWHVWLILDFGRGLHGWATQTLSFKKWQCFMSSYKYMDNYLTWNCVIKLPKHRPRAIEYQIHKSDWD
jgi:hypothetical protein